MNEEYVVSYLLSGQGQPPLSIVLLFPYRSIGPQGRNSDHLPGGPICLLPRALPGGDGPSMLLFPPHLVVGCALAGHLLLLRFHPRPG